jgi:acyl carrier protein
MDNDPRTTTAVLQALHDSTGTPIEDLLKTLKTETEWPFDSLVLAEVLAQVEEELGVSVPMDADTAKALRSVKGLIRRVSQLLEVSA